MSHGVLILAVPAVVLVLLSWTILVAKLVGARREQQRWNALMHKQVTFFQWVEGLTWFMLAVLVVLTADVAVLSWIEWH